jgi:hypothetical protein
VWFLSYFDARWKSLADFGKDESFYGRIHQVILERESYDVLPLVHPRQAAKIGAHAMTWYNLHRNWIENDAPRLLN